MKKLPWIILGITLVLLSASSMAAVTPTVCVLDYLVDADPMSKSVVSTFQYDAKAKVIQEAKPMDFLDCIEQDFPQIVIVAHAFEIPSSTPGGKPDVKLGYFLRADPSTPPSPTPLPAPLYEEKIFFDQIFSLADATLVAQKKNPLGIALKEIRIMVCDPMDIFKAYPSFNELIQSNGITLDEAPTSWFLSLFNSLPVTPFNEGWLAKSSDCTGATEWKTDSNLYCKEDYWPGCDRSQADYCIPLK
jgi:hypothetical protein